jgi:hypothetical protein
MSIDIQIDADEVNFRLKDEKIEALENEMIALKARIERLELKYSQGADKGNSSKDFV